MVATVKTYVNKNAAITACVGSHVYASMESLFFTAVTAKPCFSQPQPSPSAGLTDYNHRLCFQKNMFILNMTH